jgi:hypothetical protein
MTDQRTIAEQALPIALPHEQTAEQFLRSIFGDSIDEIEGVRAWGRTPISHAALVVGEGGILQVSCGGTVLIGLYRSQSVDKHPLFLVADLDEAAVWDLRRLAGALPLHEGRPHPRLRLVMSA